MDNCSSSSWILNILDTDRDLAADRLQKVNFIFVFLQKSYLLHCERMYNLTSIIGQFCRFIRGYDWDKASGRDFAWVGGEYSIHLLPDL